MFSDGKKIPTLGSMSQWETRQASFPTGMVDPQDGIFLLLLNTNDGFYFVGYARNGSTRYAIHCVLEFRLCGRDSGRTDQDAWIFLRLHWEPE